MIPESPEWRQRAAALAEELVGLGRLSAPEWIRAFQETPRHVLVPRFYEQNGASAEWKEVDGDGDGLRRVYSNSGLYTSIGPDPVWGTTVGLSSTSTPGLMARMLESLDIRDGHHVLEIGTGTGYNAALLCHRLGDRQVVSVDIDADLVALARDRLAALGYRPTLAAADGTAGFPDRAPYDRIIATCAVPVVPPAWIEQLRDGGLLLLDLKRSISAGNLVLLRRDGARAEGRFDARWAGFMPLRTPAADPARTAAAAHPEPRASAIGYLRPWENTVAWFLAALAMPTGVTFGVSPDPDTGEPGDVFLRAPDGSWAEVAHRPDADGRHVVQEGGPESLWGHVERAHQLYRDTGQPSWSRLGLTATAERQWAWLDHPDNALAPDLLSARW